MPFPRYTKPPMPASPCATPALEWPYWAIGSMRPAGEPGESWTSVPEFGSNPLGSNSAVPSLSAQP
jgi:hypothetical protein